VRKKRAGGGVDDSPQFVKRDLTGAGARRVPFDIVALVTTRVDNRKSR
jgi:hypothetical protein